VQAVRRPGRRAATVFVVISGCRRVVVAAVRRTFAATAGLLLLLPLAPGRATVASGFRRLVRVDVGGALFLLLVAVVLTVGRGIAETIRAGSTSHRAGVGAGGRLRPDNAVFAAVLFLWLDRGRR